MCVLCVELVLVFELRRDSNISIESFHARYKVGLSSDTTLTRLRMKINHFSIFNTV